MYRFFAENTALEGHGRHAARSGATSMVIRVGNAAFQFASALFIACSARHPKTMAWSVWCSPLLDSPRLFVDLGSREAIARRKRITPGEVAALFWITLASGWVLALFVAAMAPFIARFYGEPRLRSIALVSSLVFVTTALSCQHQALMRRAMMFRRRRRSR